MEYKRFENVIVARIDKGEEILDKVKVVDLSADYRIKDVAVYEKWYGIEHKSPQLIEEAVYGLCEINREDVKKARLVANPGCYTTCSILTAYPLVKAGLIDTDTLIIDAKSGTSGAGRGAKTANLFCEVNESIKAYGVTNHRHTPEIEEQLGYAAGKPLCLSFTPHLVPMNRGILITAYASLTKDVTYEEVKAAYDKYYDNEFFHLSNSSCAFSTMPFIISLSKYSNGIEYCDIICPDISIRSHFVDITNPQLWLFNKDFTSFSR